MQTWSKLFFYNKGNYQNPTRNSSCHRMQFCFALICMLLKMVHVGRSNDAVTRAQQTITSGRACARAHGRDGERVPVTALTRFIHCCPGCCRDSRCTSRRPETFKPGPWGGAAGRDTLGTGQVGCKLLLSSHFSPFSYLCVFMCMYGGEESAPQPLDERAEEVNKSRVT